MLHRSGTRSKTLKMIIVKYKIKIILMKTVDKTVMQSYIIIVLST